MKLYSIKYYELYRGVELGMENLNVSEDSALCSSMDLTTIGGMLREIYL